MKSNKLQKTVDKLITLRLSKGIQPFELMTNIKDKEYLSISAINKEKSIECIVEFYDTGTFDNRKEKYSYIYVYNNEMFLQEITEKTKRNTFIVWSRLKEEEKFISDIRIESNNDMKLIKDIMDSSDNIELLKQIVELKAV